MTIEEAIRHCYEVAESLRKSNPCDTCAEEHEQLARWLEELVQLRAELPDVEALIAERDAAVSDLRKLVPIWAWDGLLRPKEKDIPKHGRVEFG